MQWKIYFWKFPSFLDNNVIFCIQIELKDYFHSRKWLTLFKSLIKISYSLDYQRSPCGIMARVALISWFVNPFGLFNAKFSLYIYEVHTISFQTFFVRAFKIGVDSWKFSILLQYILWDDWPIFMISGSNKQLPQELEYTLLKPDCHSWWISKMQSDTLEERYAIKFFFKLGKNATEMYGMLQTAFRPSCMNRTSVFEWHKRFKEGRVSVRDDERCGRSKEVNTPQLIG